VSPPDVKVAVRQWILARHPGYEPTRLTDDTPLIEERLLTSIQVMDLLLYLEEVTGAPVDVTRLGKGAFATLRAIADALQPGGRG